MNFAFKSGVSVGNCSRINTRRNTTTSYLETQTSLTVTESQISLQPITTKFSERHQEFECFSFFKNRDIIKFQEQNLG